MKTATIIGMRDGLYILDNGSLVSATGDFCLDIGDRVATDGHFIFGNITRGPDFIKCGETAPAGFPIFVAADSSLSSREISEEAFNTEDTFTQDIIVNGYYLDSAFKLHELNTGDSVEAVTPGLFNVGSRLSTTFKAPRGARLAGISPSGETFAQAGTLKAKISADPIEIDKCEYIDTALGKADSYKSLSILPIYNTGLEEPTAPFVIDGRYKSGEETAFYEDKTMNYTGPEVKSLTLAGNNGGTLSLGGAVDVATAWAIDKAREAQQNAAGDIYPAAGDRPQPSPRLVGWYPSDKDGNRLPTWLGNKGEIKGAANLIVHEAGRGADGLEATISITAAILFFPYFNHGKSEWAPARMLATATYRAAADGFTMVGYSIHGEYLPHKVLGDKTDEGLAESGNITINGAQFKYDIEADKAGNHYRAIDLGGVEFLNESNMQDYTRNLDTDSYYSEGAGLHIGETFIDIDPGTYVDITFTKHGSMLIIYDVNNKIAYKVDSRGNILRRADMAELLTDPETGITLPACNISLSWCSDVRKL